MTIGHLWSNKANGGTRCCTVLITWLRTIHCHSSLEAIWLGVGLGNVVAAFLRKETEKIAELAIGLVLIES